jgi:hypothetical protein
MELQAELMHAEPGRRVVRVSALEGGRPLGSALGEAEDAETAEERAISRLRARLGKQPAAPRQAPSPAPPAPAHQQPEPHQVSPQPEVNPESPSPPPTAPQEPPMDPEDWSQELLQLDRQLQRLGWARDQEGVYLQRAFGHPSRSRLTRWADLTAFLRALEELEPGAEPASAPIPLQRGDLLSQCDTLLERLGWDTLTARRFLERHLAVSSRQQLSDAQLLQFNMLLEEAWLEAGAAAPICEPGSAPAASAATAPQSSPRRP